MRERLREALSRRLSRAVVTRSAELRLDRPAVSFSFDDIPASAATAGAEILEARGVRGSFYVCAALAGQDWQGYRLADLDAVARLARRGHEIGCHSAHHLDASRTPTSVYLTDVEANAALLASVVQRPLTSFAYPYGAIGLRTKLALQRRFEVCRGIHGAMAVGRYDRGRLDATALEAASIDRAGIDRLLDEALKRGAWLSFYSHDVSATPTRYGVTPELLSHAVDGALARGFDVAPIGAIARRQNGAVSSAA